MGPDLQFNKMSHSSAVSNETPSPPDYPAHISKIDPPMPAPFVGTNMLNVYEPQEIVGFVEDLSLIHI